MTAKHYKTAYWLGTGIFDALDAFATLETRIDAIPEEKDRGDIFEIFVEGFLNTQAIMQCDEHWIVGDIPLNVRQKLNLPSDAKGIDGVYLHRSGVNVPYQVKYRKADYLTFTEVAPFLGVTEKATYRVVFTTAKEIAEDAKNRVGMRLVRQNDFRALTDKELATIEAWLKDKPPPVIRAEPEPYQKDALADISAALKEYTRATVVMACGTGKTLVSLWAVEEAKPKTVLVLLPSLLLLQQTLSEWSRHNSLRRHFRYLCVCSDQTVRLKNDEIEINKMDVEFRIDTDPDEVRRFLKHQGHPDDVKVIFTTYHSSPVVGEAAKGMAPFDIAVFDEAHKTAGRSDSYMTYALTDDYVRIHKRLFFTATPRHYDIRKRNKEGDFEVASMDDETLYGVRAHTLSFAKAANAAIICKYKVIISLIDEDVVSDFARKNGITLVDLDPIGTKWLANVIAVKQAVELVNAKKAITFHSRVAAADDFASDQPQGIKRYLPDYSVSHVNGKQKSSERKALIDEFRRVEKSILTNAKCLTEGVDVPAVDMVAFIDPRKSRVDIAQATGRAMRRPRGKTDKTVGYVVVPVFASQSNEQALSEALKREEYDDVADVLNALQEHDDDLVDIIREIREHKGRGDAFNPRRIKEKVEFVAPRVELEQLADSIYVEIADRIGVSWDEWYGMLQAYKDRNGDCLVRNDFKTSDGSRLGQWVVSQRALKKLNKLLSGRTRRLDAIEFAWDPIADDWESMFSELAEYRKRYGDCDVLKKRNYKLCIWVMTQRMRLKRGKFSRDQKCRLDDLGFRWDPWDEGWEKSFATLVAFKELHGHCDVPKNWDENPAFSLWVITQRTRLNSGKLPPDQKSRLDDLGFIWDLRKKAWESMYSALVQYKNEYGDCNVPDKWPKDPQLAAWVMNQRQWKRTHRILPEREHRLEALGFVWSTFTSSWEQWFAALVEYKNKYGDCNVPQKWPENINLGDWVSRQRRDIDKLTPERKKRLEDLGFKRKISVGGGPGPDDEKWEKSFAILSSFRKRYSHCNVPKNWVENPSLANWVKTQRKTREKMSNYRRKKLDEMGFEWVWTRRK